MHLELDQNIIDKVNTDSVALIRKAMGNDILASVATELATKYYAIVNFVCLPQSEFEEKKGWYPYFKNIAQEGKVLYC